MINLIIFIQLLHEVYSRPARVPFHYEQQTYNRPNIYTQTHHSSSNRPGSSSSQFASVTSTQYKPGEYSNSIYSNRRPVSVSQYSNSEFNRLPERPEFDEYDEVEDEDEDDGYGETSVSNSQNAPIQQHPFLGFHKKKKRPGIICVPQAHYGGFGGLGGFGLPFKGWGLGGFHGLGFGSLFRDEPIKRSAEDRANRPPEDPRTILKLQSNFYNYGYPPVYKPTSGYPCRPVDFYGSRPGFGQFGSFDSVGGNRPGIQSDTPSRPGALGILSDTVKPVFESTAIQDGVGAAISNWTPGSGISQILNAVGGITGQFATAPVAAVKQISQINRDFMDLLF